MRNYRIQIHIGKGGTEIEAQGDKAFVQKVFAEFKGKNIETLSKDLQAPLTTGNKVLDVTEQGEPEQEKIPTLSDWITFLSSEKNPNLANIMGIGAVTLAAISVIVGIGQSDWWLKVISLLSIWVIFIVLVTWFEVRATKAGRLLKKIMSGELKNISRIKNEWNGD